MPDLVALPDRLHDGEAAEEGEVEVLDRLGEVADAADELVERVLLLVGEGLVGAGPGRDLPAECYT